MSEYAVLVGMIVVVLILFYAIIAIHDIPYEIAKKRGHPHMEAIHHAGWISMFTLHSIWPLLWIWATIYHADRGYGFGGDTESLKRQLEDMNQRIKALEADSLQAVSDTPAMQKEE